jgi:hypothetical protein
MYPAPREPSVCFHVRGVGDGSVCEQGRYTATDYPGATDTVVCGISDNGTLVGGHNAYCFGFIATPKR